MRVETRMHVKGLSNAGDKNQRLKSITCKSSIQEISRHQELQTQLRRNVHVRHVDLVLVLFIVAKVFADLFDNDTTAKQQLH